jgi:hypothetical protein
LTGDLTKRAMPDNQMLSNRRHLSFNSDGDIAPTPQPP